MTRENHMYSKTIGLFLTLISLLFIGRGVEVFTNPWPMQKILFISAIHLLVAVIPLMVGLKLLKPIRNPKA